MRKLTLTSIAPLLFGGAFALSALVACKRSGGEGETSNAAAEAPSASAAAQASSASAAAPAPSGSAKPTFEQQVAQSTPLTIKTDTALAGSLKVSAQHCQMEGGPLLGDGASGVIKSLYVKDDRLIVLAADSETLRGYKFEPGDECKLSIDKEFGENGVVKFTERIGMLSGDEQGNLWASTGYSDAYRYNLKGERTAVCSPKPGGYLQVHPSGKYAIGTFVSTVSKVTLPAEGSCKGEPWVFRELGNKDKRVGPFSSAMRVGFFGNDILFSGTLAKEVDPKETKVVAVLDAKGKEKLRFGNRDNTEQMFGWVHGLSACKVGYCVADTNFRRISLWKKDGSFFGSVPVSKIFGLKSLWMEEIVATPQGLLVAVGASRDGVRVSEGHVYRIPEL